MTYDIFSPFQQMLQTLVMPDLLINCKDFSDLMKLDLDKKNMLMKLKDMNIRFSTISTITKLKETDQINNAEISSFYNSVIQLISTIVKTFLTKAQCLTVLQKYTDLWSSHHVSGKCGSSTIKS